MGLFLRLQPWVWHKSRDDSVKEGRYVSVGLARCQDVECERLK